MKADITDIRELKKKMSKLASVKEIEDVRNKLNRKAEKNQIVYLEDQIREDRKKLEKVGAESIERGEYIGRQVQDVKGGLLECMQALAGKVEKENFDKHGRMIKELNKFDPKELRKDMIQKIKQNKGKEI